MAAFPKLLGGEARQHTYIDTESVRYVYQPIDNFFLLLITNKTSNIVEDLHTLQLLAKVLPDICGHLTEESIKNKQFDLIFSFDEALTAGGHSENITVQQIRTNLEMESHEEKLHNMILKSKRDAAKTEMKRQQQRIKVEQRDRQRMERAAGFSASTSSTAGFGSSSSSAGFGSSGYNSAPSPPSSSQQRSSTPPPAAAKATGMKLGGAKQGKNFVDAMVAEDDLADLPPMSTQVTSAPAPPVQISTEPIVAAMEEKISVKLTRDGDIEQVEVKGTLYVSANNPDTALCRLALDYSTANGINFMCHPKVNKKLFESDSILGLKDAKKPFPESRVGVLRWSLKSQDEGLLPLNITCWPEEDGNGKFTVNLEYTMERAMELHDVNIVIPVGSNEIPQVVHIDGDYRHDHAQGALIWHHDTVEMEANGTGSLEFSVRAHDLDSFFPVQINFFSKSTFADLRVASVSTIDTNEPVEFAFTPLLTTETYIVQ